MDDIKKIIQLMPKVERLVARQALPIVKCEKCKDRGYLRANVPWGHPDFGKAIKCECIIAKEKKQQQDKLIESSGILGMKRFQSATFESFNGNLEGIQEAYLASLGFAESPVGWLVLLGPYGCGKTHLASAIARKRIEAGDTVLVQTVPDLLDYLRSAFSSSVHQSYDGRFEQMKKTDLLILDDYGTQLDTGWTTEKIFQLLNYRYNGSLPTVITSNNMALVGVDPRICSRLSDRELVTIVRMDQAQDCRIHRESL